MKSTTRVVTLLGAVALCLGGVSAANAASTASANGQGTLDNNQRHFSFSAKQAADGSVSGQAELTNKAYSGGNPNSPYKLKIDITCMKKVGNTAVFGGWGHPNDNDPVFQDAVFFSVVDNGEPGKADQISRVYAWDDNATITGDPQACLVTNPGDLLPETIQSGNIQVK